MTAIDAIDRDYTDALDEVAMLKAERDDLLSALTRCVIRHDAFLEDTSPDKAFALRDAMNAARAAIARAEGREG